MSKRIRWRNFPLWLLEGLMVVAACGEDKYGTYDYLDKDYTVNDHLDALKRHLMRFESPNEPDTDEDSGELHLYNVAWRALVAAFVTTYRPHLDDRYKINASDKKE